ncbi:hypothetical protein B296_00015524 [Ensete ventricosum]|uniref:Thiolase N-terminal domain-containing protein n=1 Tax=Ensete ventricosum TaxID=4639 RepID=A0A426ZH60_ENSVE|nr:hypothetical protein B296_00015524 [Ensete ventricosum]
MRVIGDIYETFSLSALVIDEIYRKDGEGDRSAAGPPPASPALPFFFCSRWWFAFDLGERLPSFSFDRRFHGSVGVVFVVCWPLLILDYRLLSVPLATVRPIRGTLALGITSWLSRNNYCCPKFKAVVPVLTWVHGFDDMVYFLKIVDPKTGEEVQVTISVDDGIRPETSLSGLAKLKPVFKKDGSTTAGNRVFVISKVHNLVPYRHVDQLSVWYRAIPSVPVLYRTGTCQLYSCRHVLADQSVLWCLQVQEWVLLPSSREEILSTGSPMLGRSSPTTYCQRMLCRRII